MIKTTNYDKLSLGDTKVKAKIELTINYGVNWANTKATKQKKQEVLELILVEGEVIDGMVLGNKFKVLEISEEYFKFNSQVPIARNNENGTISLLNTQKEFALKMNEEIKLHPAMTDVSCSWQIGLIDIF